MDPRARVRQTRQIRLAEIGEVGQARIGAARAVVATGGFAGEVEARYLAGAGVGVIVANDAKQAAVARAVDPEANVEIAGEATGGGAIAERAEIPAWAATLDPAARDVAVGAAAALGVVRRAVFGDEPSRAVASAASAAPAIRSVRLASVCDAVGRTPLVRLRRVAAKAPDVAVYAKLEFANPGGSVKDRAALRMIRDAQADGRLTPEKILIDATSGNTGVAYSIFGAALGVRVRLVMPSNVSKARMDITRAFGTEILFSDPMEGTDGAIRRVRAIVAEAPDRYFYPDQYSNPSNPAAHYDGTGVEILEAVGDRITHFVAGIGTSGTMMGTTRRLKEHTRPIRCVAVEPREALHGLEGLKHMASSMVPAIYDPRVPDEIVPVTTEDGWDMADRLAREEGLHVGHSSGANVFAAVNIAEALQVERGGGCVVVIVCDRGDRYFAPMKWERKYVW